VKRLNNLHSQMKSSQVLQKCTGCCGDCSPGVQSLAGLPSMPVIAQW